MANENERNAFILMQISNVYFKALFIDSLIQYICF